MPRRSAAPCRARRSSRSGPRAAARRDPNVCSQVAGTKWCGAFCSSQCPPYVAVADRSHRLLLEDAQAQLHSRRRSVRRRLHAGARARLGRGERLRRLPGVHVLVGRPLVQRVPAGEGVNQIGGVLRLPAGARAPRRLRPTLLHSHRASTTAGQVRLGRRLRRAVCRAGHLVTNGTCAPCPAGTYSLGGGGVPALRSGRGLHAGGAAVHAVPEGVEAPQARRRLRLRAVPDGGAQRRLVPAVSAVACAI